MTNRNYFRVKGGLLKLPCGFLLLLSSLSTPAIATPNQANPTVETIVAKLMAANERRAQMLRGYRGKRVYHLDYHGFLGTHSAQLEAEVTYTAPNKKDFRVLSQTGAKVLVNRVLLKLLESEKEAAQQQIKAQTELSPKNYAFTLIQVQHATAGDSYTLGVQPREKSKFVYSGKIWVDAADFAVSRMEGEPAKNPSLWISRTKIEYTWSKIGGFWLPLHNQSVTQVRLGGSAVLTIDYTDYQITGTGRTNGPRGSDKSVLPDPASMTPEQR